jgi:hypothetical protein
MKRLFSCIIIIAFLALNGYATTIVSAGHATGENLEPGTSFKIDIEIKDVYDLYGYDVKLSFDPEIIIATDLKIGSFLYNKYPSNVWVIRKVIESNRVWVAVCLYGVETGVSGSGILATITFEVVGYGTSILDLYDVDLADYNAMPISREVQNGFFSNKTTKISVENLNSLDLKVGDIFSVNIIVQGVFDLAKYDFKLGFDPEIILTKKIKIGSFFYDPYPDNVEVLKKEIGENYVWIAVTLFDITEGVTGDGILATITFEAISDGESTLDLYDVMLEDSYAELIPCDVQDSKVTIKSKQTEANEQTTDIETLTESGECLILSGAKRHPESWYLLLFMILLFCAGRRFI